MTKEKRQQMKEEFQKRFMPWVRYAVEVCKDECDAREMAQDEASRQALQLDEFLYKMDAGSRKRFCISEIAAFAEVFGLSMTEFMARVESKKAVIEETARKEREAVRLMDEATHLDAVPQSMFRQILALVKDGLPDAAKVALAAESVYQEDESEGIFSVSE